MKNMPLTEMSSGQSGIVAELLGGAGLVRLNLALGYGTTLKINNTAGCN